MYDSFDGIAFSLSSDGQVVSASSSVAASGTVVRVAAAGVCGSDLVQYRQRLAHPGTLPALPLGHEVAGTVAHGGEGWPVGTAVVVDPAFYCGGCPPCAAGNTNHCTRLMVLGHSYGSGGLARYVSVPEASLVRVPTGLDAVSAALVEPLACAHRAAHRVTEHGPALVFGAGTIGLGVALVLRSMGREVAIVDPSPHRRALALSIGLFLRESGRMFPVVIEASGTPTAFRDALESVSCGGQVVVAAQHTGTMALDAGVAFGKEIQLTWSLGALRSDFRAVVDLITSETLDPRRLATPLCPNDFSTDALHEMAAGRSAKPVVVWEAAL